MLIRLILLSLTYLITSCASNQTPQASQAGSLSLVANGEDFVREGFVSKDGWKIEFDRVTVNLAAVKAYQSEPPFDPQGKETLKAQKTVTLLENSQTVDLAAGTAPTLVTTVEAHPGGYNALAWQLVPSATGETIVLQGKATKEGKTVKFELGLNQKLDYICGEYVGEERKGWLKAGEKAELETTFHFDHLFGSAEAPPDDALNQGALGFAPLAKLAKNGQLTIEQTSLAQKLSPSDYQKLTQAIAGLGHVGEGHCQLQK